jgi:F-type H+-transporting ATPase subunit alpha
VSRVGGNAQTKAMKKVSGKLKLELAQFRELEAFMQFSSDLDAETKQRIDGGRRMTQVLNQGRGVPLPFEMEVAVIFAATNGYLDRFPAADIMGTERELRDYFSREGGGVLTAIRESREIREETDKTLRAKLDAFVERRKPI